MTWDEQIHGYYVFNNETEVYEYEGSLYVEPKGGGLGGWISPKEMTVMLTTTMLKKVRSVSPYSAPFGFYNYHEIWQYENFKDDYSKSKLRTKIMNTFGRILAENDPYLNSCIANGTITIGFRIISIT